MFIHYLIMYLTIDLYISTFINDLILSNLALYNYY